MKKLDKKTVQSLANLYKSNNLFKLETKAKKLLKKYPNELNLHNLLGISFAGQKKFNEAIKSFQKILAIKPSYAEIYCNIGNVFYEQEKYNESIINYSKAIKIKPDYAEAYYNIANAQKNQNKFKKAIVNYYKTLKINPNYAEAYCNLGNVKKYQGNYDEAEINYKKALSINPDYKAAYINLSYLNLSRENFIEGWESHEQRNEIAILFKTLKLNKEKLWDGNKFSGKLLVIGEQGLGDYILFGSMLHSLIKAHKNVTVMINNRLLSIFKRSFPKITFIANNENIDKYMYKKYIFLGSLGKFFRKSSSSFSNNKVSFLIPSKSKVNMIEDLFNNKTVKKVGLSWRTESKNNREERSIHLKNFLPILKIKNFQFINLQYGDTQKERNLILKKFGKKLIYYNSLDYTNDIEGLAALIFKCDLIITIANFTAQLAGSLGVPTWVLLPYSCHWRWFVNRTDSLWYPSIKLFRQTKLGDWDSVIRRVEKNLRK